MVLLDMTRYFYQVVIDGEVYNEFLYLLPSDLRDAAITIGKAIAEVLFG